MELNESDKRIEAKHLYWQGYRVKQIADKLGEKPPTVHSWKRRDEWESTPVIQRVEASIDVRLTQLIAKGDKTDGELREIDVLSKALERTARVRKYDQGGNEADLNPKLKNRNRGPKRQPQKNYLDEDQIQALVDAFESSLFGYQKKWKEAALTHRIRDILKSRQIGATWYFAREALIDAVTTGRNQIFLSASKAQAHVFKLYILQFVQEVTGVELKGDPIVLPNGATMYFLGTNARTAQSYHGNVYMDEYFWIPRFKDFRKVASGMAMHKKWRQTYISTPSALSHEAYPFWNGEHYNRGRPKTQHISLDVSHKHLKDGQL
ncbi:MAG: terminase family protein, partial [Candidatus Pacearchaeota archaeon]|nr:terminase family protein [Candidatus Pacearchaeota archaeon]